MSQGYDMYQNNKNAMQNPIQLEIEPDGIHKTFHLPYTCRFQDIKVAVQCSINAGSPDEFLVLGKKGKPLAATDDEIVKTYHLTTIYVHRIQKKRNLLEELNQLEKESVKEEKASEEAGEDSSSMKAELESSEDEDYDNYGALSSTKPKPVKVVEPSEHPKYLISKNPEYIELLVRLLEVGDGFTFIKTAWDLLMKLPVSRKLALELRDLKMPEGGEFHLNELLPLNSMHKMLYSLQIVRELAEAEDVAAKEEAKEERWGARYLEKGGLAHLLEAV